MIIKKWDSTANSGNGDWVELYPKTTTAKIFDTAGNAVFETIGSQAKIKTAFLPNSVFDSLRFHGTFSAASGNSDIVNDFVDVLKGIKEAASTASRSEIGYYLVFSAGGSLANASSTTAGAIATTFKAQYTFEHGDSTSSTNPSSVTVEAGDWVVVESASGAGTTESPYIVTLSVVSNTYELYQGATNLAAGSPGLVPSAAIVDKLKFLRGDGTYATPSNTRRAIEVGGTEILTSSSTTPLDLIAGTHMSITNSGGDVTITGSLRSVELDGVEKLTPSSTTALNIRAAGGMTITESAGRFTFNSADTLRRPIEVEGTEILASNVATALDLIGGVGITASNSGGDVTFKQTYPVKVGGSAPDAASGFRINDGALWFDL
jgi:hypothetical protein